MSFMKEEICSIRNYFVDYGRLRRRLKNFANRRKVEKLFKRKKKSPLSLRDDRLFHFKYTVTLLY